MLGIIERGETDHGLVMGQSVTKSVIELQIKHNKPIGLGIMVQGRSRSISSRDLSLMPDRRLAQ